MKFNLPKFSSFDQISFLDKLFFTKHLAVMLKSGITLPEAIEVIRDQSHSRAFKSVLGDVGAGLKNGLSLQKTLDRNPKVFDPLYRSIIGIGEESGNLETNLGFLAEQLGKEHDFRRKIGGALLYPAIVVCTVLVVGGGVAVFVLPQLVGLFTSLEVELPLSTKILLVIAKAMKEHGAVIVGGGVAAVVGAWFTIRSEAVRPRWEKMMLSMPIFGQFLQGVQIATFCRNLGLMLRSALPISTALATARDATGHSVYKKYIGKIKEAVDAGRSIESELATGKYPLIPLLVAKMIGVGEKTGKLDEALLYLADFFEEETDGMVKNLETVLEPILLLGIALAVAFLAISIISPIYKFTASAGGG